MKKFVQFVVGVAAMCFVAPFLFGTPFNHWMVFVPIFAGAMYGTALLQHYGSHWRRPR